MISQKNLISRVKALPEVHLELIGLVWDLRDDKGEIDTDKLLQEQDKLQKAGTKARAYAGHTQHVIAQLESLIVKGD